MGTQAETRGSDLVKGGKGACSSPDAFDDDLN